MSDGVISIELSKDEALILFDFLGRADDLKQFKFEDQAEQIVLWRVEGLLEKRLVEPFDPKYRQLVETARNRVREPKP